MNKEQKELRILQILNHRTQNSFFIDVERKNIEVNKIILLKLYHEKLLDLFLDEYYKKRLAADNYNKKNEYLSSIESYINSFTEQNFESDNLFFDHDNLKNIFTILKENLKSAIENAQPEL